MRSSSAVLIAVMLASSTAHADAWSVAKRVIPGGMTVVGLDLNAIKKHAIGVPARKVYEELTSGIQRQFRDAQSQCGIDIWDRLSSAVLAFDLDSARGAAFVQLRGVERSAFVDCLRKVDADPKRVVANEGDLILVTNDGDIDLAVAWIGGVLVVPFRNNDVISGKEGRKRLMTMISGGGVAKDAILIRALRDIDTSAAVWGVIGERLEWDGDDFDDVSHHSSPPARHARRDPFLFAQSAEPPAATVAPEPGESDDNRKATLVYAVAQAKLGESSRLTVIGHFKTNGSWAAAGLETELREERMFAQLGVRFTSTDTRVQATVELASSAFIALLNELD